jgi:hypothetical protein
MCRAIRGTIAKCEGTFPAVADAERVWPRDFDKTEREVLLEGTRSIMVKQPEILKVIIDGGELDAAINQLRKDIPAATNLPFSVLRNVVADYRSGEDQKN